MSEQSARGPVIDDQVIGSMLTESEVERLGLDFNPDIVSHGWGNQPWPGAGK